MNSMCLRGIRGRPTLPLRDLRRQNSWNPFRCQRITVSGLTITSADCHPPQSFDSPTQKTRSEGRSCAPDGLVFELGLRPGASPLIRYRSGDVALPEAELHVPVFPRRAA